MSERVVVVTGASAGLGRAIACAFAREGDRVALVARGRAGLEAAAAEVRQLGGKAVVYPADVADADALDAVAEAVERELGPIDVWVNNAMVAVLGEVADTTAEEFRRVTDVTYLGSVHGTQSGAAQDAAARPGAHHPGRLRARPPRHPASGDLLRSQARDPGLLRVPALRAAPPRKHRRPDDRPAARDEHHPVRLGAPPCAQSAAAGPAHLRARAGRPRRRLGLAPSAPPELWVGAPTALTIVGNRLAPWVAEWYLGRTGFGSQQTDTPAAPDRPDYVEAPLDDRRDFGADGSFTDQAKTRSPQLWAATHRPAVAGIGALVAGALAALARRAAA